MKKVQSNADLHIFLKLACLVIILAGIRAAADIIVQLLLALFFVIMLNPLVIWFLRRGVKRSIAIAVVTTAMAVILIAIIAILASSVNEFGTMLPKYNKELICKIIALRKAIPFLSPRFSPERIFYHIASEKLMTYAAMLMSILSSAMVNILLLAMTVVFMLFEVHHIPYKLRFALNNSQIHIAGLHRAIKNISHYLALKTLLSLWTGVIIWLGLTLMNTKFALACSMLAFFLNYIPIVGAVISAIPPMIQALLFNGFYECFLTGVLFLVVHTVINNMVEPRMMGHRLGMSSLVVFLSLLIWGWLLGPIGALLSAPLTSVCKTWMESTKSGGKLAILLGPGSQKNHLSE